MTILSKYRSFLLMTVITLISSFISVTLAADQKNKIDRKSKFLDVAAEASIEEAIAVGYSRLGKVNNLQENIDNNALNSTTVKNGNQYDTQCGDAAIDIGTTQVSPDSDVPDQVNQTVVILGDVSAVSLGCYQ